MKKLVMGLLLCCCCGSVFEPSMGMKGEQRINKQQEKAFRYASKGNVNGLKRLILDGGIDVNQPNKDGETLLQVASRNICFYDNPMADLVTYLILNGANIQDKDGCYYETSGSFTPMDILVNDPYINVSCLVAIAKNQKIDIYNAPCCQNGANIFLSAISNNRQDIVKYLSNTNYAIWNSKDDNGDGPLYYAVQSEDLNMITFVLQNGVSINEVNNAGQTVLHGLASYIDVENLDNAQFFVNHQNMDINKQDTEGNTPLHIAAEFNNLSIIDLLLNIEGIEVNSQNSSGNTPLHIAVSFRNESVVNNLLSRENIDFTLTNKEGLTPFYLTISEIFRWLNFASIEHYLKILEVFAEKNIVPPRKEVEEFLNSKDPDPEKKWCAKILGILYGDKQ